MTKQKILVPLDGSPFSRQMFEKIRQFFEPDSVEVLLLEVLEPMNLPMYGENEVTASDMIASAVMGGGASYAERQAEVEKLQHQNAKAILRQHERLLRESAKGLELNGYKIEAHALLGEPVEQIIRYANEAGVDLIAMMTHGRSGLNKLVMGSVAERVLHEASVPILLARPANN